MFRQVNLSNENENTNTSKGLSMINDQKSHKYNKTNAYIKLTREPLRDITNTISDEENEKKSKTLASSKRKSTNCFDFGNESLFPKLCNENFGRKLFR